MEQLGVDEGTDGHLVEQLGVDEGTDGHPSKFGEATGGHVVNQGIDEGTGGQPMKLMKVLMVTW